VTSPQYTLAWRVSVSKYVSTINRRRVFEPSEASA
jgi:hypothetical protein